MALMSCVLCTLTSCENKALVQKNQELREQLTDLEKQVSLLQISAGKDPGDQTAALKKANDELVKALEQLEQLDDERESLEESCAKTEKELRAYQKKYTIR